MIEKFNYCIGHYWKGDAGSIAVYAYGTEVHYGTMEDAENFLKYVQSNDSDNQYKIFKVIES
jgi:hypothetical protein